MPLVQLGPCASFSTIIEASQHAGVAALSSGPALALSCAAPRQILNSGCYRPRCPIWPHSANTACRKLSRRRRPTPTSQKSAGRAKLQEGVWLTWSGSIVVRSASCALPTMSSEPIVPRLQAHADVNASHHPRHKPSAQYCSCEGTRHNRATRYAVHQRSSRGPNAAPARVHSTIVPPYQTEINGSESSVQWSA